MGRDRRSELLMTNRLMDKLMDICNSGVTFATDKVIEKW